MNSGKTTEPKRFFLRFNLCFSHLCVNFTSRIVNRKNDNSRVPLQMVWERTNVSLFIFLFFHQSYRIPQCYASIYLSVVLCCCCFIFYDNMIYSIQHAPYSYARISCFVHVCMREWSMDVNTYYIQSVWNVYFFLFSFFLSSSVLCVLLSSSVYFMLEYIWMVYGDCKSVALFFSFSYFHLIFFSSCFYSIQLTLHFFISTPPWLLIRYAFILSADCLLLISLFQRYFTASFLFYSHILHSCVIILNLLNSLCIRTAKRQKQKKKITRGYFLVSTTIVSKSCNSTSDFLIPFLFERRETKKKKIIDTLSFKFPLTSLTLSPSKF